MNGQLAIDRHDRLASQEARIVRANKDVLVPSVARAISGGASPVSEA